MIINKKKLQDREAGINVNGDQYMGDAHTQNRLISFYDEAPHDIIGIYEFQNIAVSRLQVLKKIQFLYDANKEASKEYMAEEINKYSRQHRLNIEGIYDSFKKTQGQRSDFAKIPQNELKQAMSNDKISHFICRLAYCRNDELRKWFVTQETRLFYHRLASYEPQDVLLVLREKCNMNYEQLTDRDQNWIKFKEQIGFNTKILPNGARFKAEEFIKVPFKDALNLVNNRQVFMHKGIAFVHISDLNQIARSQFRAKLMGELMRAYKYLPTILKDARLSKLLINLSNHNSIDFNLQEVAAPKDGDKIRLADLDYYQRKSFPPCMKTLFTALKNQHHLKHFGRLQLGLFLKGIGLTMDEAMQFWKQEFAKKGVDGDKFEKNYGYNIRHMFGQEGKRNDYKSWNCQKVIGQQAPGKGEYHGCPFKTFGDDNLKQILSTYGLSSSDMNVILDKRKENLHQVACLRLFELSHKGGIADNVGNHPNSFFNSSVAYNKEVDKKKQKVQGAPAAAASKPLAKDNEMVDEQIKS